ncbi:MAG: universal stress protein [Pseudomonadota bacterium]
MKILVAADGSRYSKRMLAYLAAHDEWLGGRHSYTVLTVVPQVPARAASALPKAVLKAHHEEEAERVLRPIRSFFDKQGLQAEFVAKAGEPAEAIAAMAAKGKYNLLVMGSHGHGALGNLVLGSVATRVMAQCTTPLLLVR